MAEVGGLVFVWPAGEPEPLEPAEAKLAAGLAPQGLARARIAQQIDYEVHANWKLVWENNRECWHCHAGHPQYVVANFDTAPDTARTRQLARDRAADHERALAGIVAGGVKHSQPGLARFPTTGRWWSANRTPLVSGFVTLEALDACGVTGRTLIHLYIRVSPLVRGIKPVLSLYTAQSRGELSAPAAEPRFFGGDIRLPATPEHVRALSEQLMREIARTANIDWWE